MSIWHKILVGLVAVAALACFYMATRTLKMRKSWGEEEIAYRKLVENQEKENEALVAGTTGDSPTPGIEQLKDQLHTTILHRGRVWRNCTAKVANAATGQATVTIDKPEPHGIPEKKVLYVFEEKFDPEGKEPFNKNEQYLGEFKVVRVDEAKKLIEIEPTMKFSPRELNRLKESKSPWTLYEIMPRDTHDVFADAREEDLKAMLPESSVAEYVRDGKPAEASDPPASKQTTKDDKEIFIRSLRNYEVLFRNFFRDRTEMFDAMESGQSDESRMTSSIENVKKQEEHCNQTIKDLKNELSTVRREQDAAVAHRKIVEQKLAEAKQRVAERIRLNMATAQEIARLQREAAQRINQRTGVPAAGGSAAAPSVN